MVYLLGDPVSYGLLGIMINMTNIARVLVSTGLPQATSKFIADNDEDLTYPILRTSMKLQWIIGGGHRRRLLPGRAAVGEPAQRPDARAVLLGRRAADPAHGRVPGAAELLQRHAPLRRPVVAQHPVLGHARGVRHRVRAAGHRGLRRAGRLRALARALRRRFVALRDSPRPAPRTPRAARCSPSRRRSWSSRSARPCS